VFGLLGVWVVDRLFLNRDGAVTWIRTPANLPAILLLMILGVQWCPLPASWVAFISPQSYSDQLALHQTLDTLGADSVGSYGYRLAYYPHPVRLMWLKVLSYAGMFFLVVHVATSKRRIMGLVYTLVGLGLFESLYGLFQIASETPRVWWWVHSRFSDHATGTYIVPNHYAGYLLMSFFLTMGCMTVQQPKQNRMISGLGGGRARVQHVIAWFAPESFNPRTAVLFFLALFMGVALYLSGSREGFLSLTFALMGGIGLVKLRSRFKWRKASLLLFCLSLLSFGIYLGIESNVPPDRVANSWRIRQEVIKEIRPMLGDYFIFGVGGGNFRHVYPRYMMNLKDKVSSSGHAHNDWIEMGCDAGMAGLLVVVILSGAAFYGIFRAWRNRSDRFAIGIGAGVLGGLLAMGVYGFMDLNMHIPATPLTLSALAGIGFAAVHRQRKGLYEQFFYAPRTIRPAKPFRMGLGMILITGLVFSSIATIQHFWAETQSPTEWNSTLHLNWNPSLETLEKALSYVPGNAENLHRRALRYASMGAVEDMEKRRINEQAISAFSQTLSHNPTLSNVWHDLGYRLSYQTADPYLFIKRWLPAADRCFDAAVRWAPMKPDLIMSCAWYWVWRANMLPETTSIPSHPAEAGISTKKDGIRKFQGLFQRALRLKPDHWEKAAGRVYEYFQDDLTILGIVPPENNTMQRQVLQWVVNKII